MSRSAKTAHPTTSSTSPAEPIPTPHSDSKDDSKADAATNNDDSVLINVIDLEATCFKPWTDQTQDVIEIGITTINTTTHTSTTTHSILVHPTHSTITPFCTQLTTITPQQVADSGVTFRQAMAVLEERFHLSERLFASYGAFDVRLLKRQVAREGLEGVRWPVSFVNVKKLVAVSYRLKKECGMKAALNVCKLQHVGVHHRGDDDSRNIAAILLHLLKRHAKDQVIEQNIESVAAVV